MDDNDSKMSFKVNESDLNNMSADSRPTVDCRPTLVRPVGNYFPF